METKDKLLEILALKWIDQRYGAEIERLLVEQIGQPANDDWPK
jgi:hypothetical protein